MRKIALGSVGALVIAMAGIGFWLFRDRPPTEREVALEAKSISAVFRRPAHLGVRYYLFPPSSGRQTQAPLIVYLHGHDEGTGGVPAEVSALVESDAQDEFPAWILAPRVPLPYWWTAGSRGVLAALIRETVRNYPIDPARVYIIGFSLGSTAAMHMLTEHPKYFAAAVLLSGRALPAKGLARTPLWQMIGEYDQTFSPSDSDRMVRELQNLGADARFTKVKGKGHVILDVLGEQALREWLFARRNPEPGELTAPDSSPDSP